MSDACTKSIGIEHSATLAFLIAVFIFRLPVLAVSSPFGTAFFSLAMACVTLCVLALSRSRQTIGKVE